MRPLRVIQGLANVVVAALLFDATIPFWRVATSGDCNNVAGGCIRMRQELGMALIASVCVVDAALCRWNAAPTILSAARPWRFGAVLLAGAILLGAVRLIDPIGHLDNRFDGWLSSA